MTGRAERILRQERRGRAWKFVGGLVLLMVGASLAVAAWGAYRIETGERGGLAVLMGLGVGFAVGGLQMAWKMRPWNRRWEAEPAPARRERLQAQRNHILWAFPLVSVVMLAVAVDARGDIMAGDAALTDYLGLFLPVLYSGVVAIVVMGWDFQSRVHREYLDDELTGAMRAKALGTGFVVLMAASTLALGILVLRPEHGVMALITALTLGGAAAGLRFAWLDREAGLPERADG